MTDLLALPDVIAALHRDGHTRWISFEVGQDIRFTGHNQGVHAHESSGIKVIYTGTTEFDVTREALQELCAQIGLARAYARDCPPQLLAPHLNYWYRGGLNATRKPSRYQFLLTNDDTAVAFSKTGREPLSTRMLLDVVSTTMTGHTGELVAVHPAHENTLRKTTTRLILPHTRYTVGDDQWSPGIQIRNSLTGLTQTYLEAVRYRHTDNTFHTDTHLLKGPYSRKPATTDTEATDWIVHATSDLLTCLDETPQILIPTLTTTIDGDLTSTLKDLFDHYRIHVRHRAHIIDTLIDIDQPTMYDLINAVSAAALDPDITAADTDTLVHIAGDLPYNTTLCTGCHRFTHHH